jgi:copper chaperone CopZ
LFKNTSNKKELTHQFKIFLNKLKLEIMKFSKIPVLSIALILATTIASFAQTTKETIAVIADSTKTISTKVKGVTCGDDLKTISANVEKIKGVQTCIAGKTGPTTTFQIAYNPAVTTALEIHDAIKNTGGCKNPDDRPYTIKQ